MKTYLTPTLTEHALTMGVMTGSGYTEGTRIGVQRNIANDVHGE